MEKTFKDLRKNAKLTQENISNKLNVKQVAVSYWEKGQREPSLKTLKSLTEVLHCSMEQLVDALICSQN